MIKRIRNIGIILLLFVFIATCLNAKEKKFYVSPVGNDINLGTKDKPFLSLTAARNAIRNYRKTNETATSFTVWLADGFYEMTEPLELTSIDGGKKGTPVTYKAQKGASPVFSGGKKVEGFQVNSSGIWELKLPWSETSKLHFDQLYVNGKRATMARTPNTGYLKIDKVEQTIIEKGEGRIAEKAEQVISFDAKNFSPLISISEKEIEQVRFRAYHKWDFTLRFIDKLDATDRKIFTSGKGMKPWNKLTKGTRIVFENYLAAVDTVGEWHLNNNGTLYYFPRKGETPENSEVIIPLVENIISIKGDATKNDFVEYVNFEGLSFAHCSYKMPKSGSEPNQAAALVNAAIQLEGAKNIRFEACCISKTGQHALWFGKGCSNSIVEKCYLSDLGGGGIYLGDFEALKGVEHTSNIKIHNNIIQSGGQEFPSAVGVWVGHSSDCEVSNNDIGNFYYTGVSVGWLWGYNESFAKRNKVVYNNIHHIGWALLSDMAAVYTLGKSEGTVISNNVVHHVNAYSYGGWGLYTDEGSSGITMENNLVYNTKTGGFHQHYGKDNIIRNNIFAFAKLYQAQCTRAEKHRSFNFENNILVFNKGVVLKGAWEKIDIQMDNNLYWNTSGDEYVFNGKSFGKWQETGHDKNAIIANPYFKNALKYNFEIVKKDNIKRIDFKPFDYSKAGVYGSNRWKEKATLPENIIREFDEVVRKNNHKF